MDENYQKLYEYLSGNGITDLSAEDFYANYSDVNGEKYQELYKYLRSEGITDLDSDSFNVKYFGVVEQQIDPEKKNTNSLTPSQENELPLNELPSSSSTSEEMSLDSPSYLEGLPFKESTNPFDGTILSGEDVDEFQISLDGINEELTSDREEESVVAEMNYKFGDYGFEFEQTNIGDAMVVTAANGKKKKIVLDAFGIPLVSPFLATIDSKTSLRGGELFAKSRANDLKKFLEENKEESAKIFAERTNKRENQLKKIQNLEELQALNTLFNTQVDDFSNKVKKYELEKLRLSNIYSNNFTGLSPSELKNNPDYTKYLALQKNLKTVEAKLINEQKSFQIKGREFDGMVGEYTQMLKDAKGGTFDIAKKIERLANTFMEGTGGAFISMLEEVSSFGADKLLLATNTFDAGDSYTNAGEHIDYAVELLQNNTDRFTIDSEDLMLQGIEGQPLPKDVEEQNQSIKKISRLLNKGNLNLIDQDQLRKALSNLQPEVLQETLESITNKDGNDLHSVTESMYRNTKVKALREYEDTEIEDVGGPLRKRNVTAYEKAKSAALGDAFNVNRYTGRVNYMDLESGTRDDFRNFLSDTIGQESNEDEMIRKFVKNEGAFIEKALHGVAYSIPAFVGLFKSAAKKAVTKGGPVVIRKMKNFVKDKNNVSRVARLMSQSFEAQMGKMANNPNFDNISLDEQRTVAAPVAVATAVLENLGFRSIFKNPQASVFLNNIVLKALTKAKPGTSAKGFGRLIREDVNNMAARGALTILAGGVVEFETGALQFVAEDLSERIYNSAKEKQMFQTPDTFRDYMGELLYQGALEAVGGKVMAIPSAITAMGANPQNLNSVTDEAFDIFKNMLDDSQYKKFFVTQLKQRVADTKDPLTQKDADEMLKVYNQIEGLFPSIPKDLNLQGQRDALGLLMEQQQLKSEVEGKNENLVKRQLERIKQIDTQLGELVEKGVQEQDLARQAETSIPEFNSKQNKETQGEVVPVKEEVYEEGESSSTGKGGKTVTTYTTYSDGSVKQVRRDFDADGNLKSESENDITSEFKDKVLNENGELVDLTVDRFAKQNINTKKVSEKTFDNKATTSESNVTKEEQEDIKTQFEDGTEETSTSEAVNLFFNRKGKSKKKLNSIKQGVRNQILNTATNAAKAITKVLPDTKIILHESSKEFSKATGTNGRGFFNFNDNVIHIDMNKANTSTVFHEVGHAFIFNTLGETNTANALKTLLNAAEKGLNSNSLLARQIKRFAQAYAEEGDTIQNEEQLAELFGQLAANYQQLNQPTQNAVINFIKKIGNLVGFNFDIVTKQDSNIIGMLNALSSKVSEGRQIVAEDLTVMKNLKETGTQNIGNPTALSKKITEQEGREMRDVKPFTNLYDNSLIKPDNLIDIVPLINNIVDNKQKVWFWSADQLGVNQETGIDGGPSSSFVEDKVKNGEIWSSSMSTTEMEGNIKKSDYIFIISGSPNVMHLFNKVVFDNITDGLPPFKTYKKQVLKLHNDLIKDGEERGLKSPTGVPKIIVETLENSNSYEDIREKGDGKFRKAFLIQHQNQKNKNTPYNEYIRENGYFVDESAFIDGFYKDNGFDLNDIMLVLKPTGVREGANHSTYNNAIIGEVVGVPNKVINSFDVMPLPLQKRAKNITKSQQTQVIAPYGSGIKFVSRPKLKKKTPKKGREQKSIEEIGRFFNMNEQGFMPKVINTSELRRFLPAGVTIDTARTGSYFLRDANGRKLNPFSPRGRQQKDIVDIINESREANFRDEVIKDYLIRVKKFPSKVVNELLEVSTDLFGTLPSSFKNVVGGVTAGVKLFSKVKAFEQKLIKSNLRKKVKLTEQQIADQTIEFLEKQPEFKKEGDGTKTYTTRQAAMLYEFQKTVGTRPSENIQEKLSEARRLVFQRKRGAKDLQKVKSLLRNFIRKSLPKDIYTRSEVMKLVRKITDAKESNIENIFNEVTDLVTKKNNSRLQNVIDNILNGKYITRQGGRVKAAKISLGIKERLARIKKDMLKSTATAEEIDKENSALTKELNRINQKDELSDGDLSRIEDIHLLLNLNNSLQMKNDDVNKTGSLDVASKILEDLITQGKTELKQELEESHAKYISQANTAMKSITGEEVDLGDKESRDSVDLQNIQRKNQRIDRTRSVIKKFINVIGVKTKKFFNEAEALDGLMDLIGKLPGEMFGGPLQTLVTARVDASTRRYKQRMMEQELILNNKFTELYGKKWRNQVRRNNKIDKTTPTYILNKAELEKAQKDFDNGDISAYDLRQVMKRNEVYLTQNEMAYYYNLYKDPANIGSFKATFGKDYANIMEEIESKMDDKVKEFADWQVNEYYPSLYPVYNDVYKSLYRTNMPWNKFYSGMIYREGVEQESIDLLADKSIYNTSVGASSTKFRVNNSLPIRKMNSMNVMFTYLRDMEYFAAYGETIRDVNKIFTNKQVKGAIEGIHGAYVNNLIQDMIGKIANKGVRNSPADRFVNMLNNFFIISRIGLNPTVMIKQLTSMITYANDIGYVNWIKYSMKNMTQVRSTFKEISESSVYMKDRNRTSITRVIESYSESGMAEFVPNQYWDFYVNFVMFTTKFGDKAAIYLGGMPNYMYYKDKALKRGLNEEQAKKEAILKFERDTKRTQQSMDLQDRDYYQTAGALQRGLNMFLTTPKQYLRKEIQSTRNLYRKVKAWDRSAGKGSLGQNLRTFLTYHILAPTLFQYVALGLPGILRDPRDEDLEDIIRAAIVGNLNALFIVGELVNSLGDVIQKKPYAGQSVKSIAPLMSIERLTDLYMRYDKTKDPVKKQEALEKFTAELLSQPGIPATQIQKFIKNMDKLGKDGDIGTDILRLLNYSEYQITGPKKKTSTTKTKSIAEQNAEYYKEQKRKKKQTKKLGGYQAPK